MLSLTHALQIRDVVGAHGTCRYTSLAALSGLLAFTHAQCAVDRLDWAGLGLDDHHAQCVFRHFRKSTLSRLTRLSLNCNPLGEAGVLALVSALIGGAMARVSDLRLCSVGMGDRGLIELSDAIQSSGILTSLTQLYLNNNLIGDKGVTRFANAVTPSVASSVPGVDVYTGCRLHGLEVLTLASNCIGVAGQAALACACEEGALPSMVRFTLTRNPDTLVPDIIPQAHSRAAAAAKSVAAANPTPSKVAPLYAGPCPWRDPATAEAERSRLYQPLIAQVAAAPTEVVRVRLDCDPPPIPRTILAGYAGPWPDRERDEAVEAAQAAKQAETSHERERDLAAAQALMREEAKRAETTRKSKAMRRGK